MEMEELNKSQIVLLTLLVSFVTSLATGIVTVSLMEQGVSPVTTTINQIVERTKEIIVRVPEPQDPIVITETVTVHQSDLVAAAVAKNKDSSIIIYKVVLNEVPVEEVAQDDKDSVEESIVENVQDESFIADTIDIADQTASVIVAIEEPAIDRLVFVSRSIALDGGLLITDSSLIDPAAHHVVLNDAGQRVDIVLQSGNNGMAIFTSSVGTSTSLQDATTLQRGQAIIALSGVDRLRVTTGIISDIVLTEGIVTAIEIDKVVSTPGSMLINMSGRVVGMSTGASRANGSAWFTPSNIIEAALHAGDNTDI